MLIFLYYQRDRQKNEKRVIHRPTLSHTQAIGPAWPTRQLAQAQTDQPCDFLFLTDSEGEYLWVVSEIGQKHPMGRMGGINTTIMYNLVSISKIPILVIG